MIERELYCNIAIENDAMKVNNRSHIGNYLPSLNIVSLSWRIL